MHNHLSFAVCRKDQFHCPYEGCIDRKHICDGNKHCSDGSDEAYCTGTGNSKSEIQSNQIKQNQSCSPMEGWKLLSNWHLHPSMGTMSYSEARDECKNLGANLVDKDSFQEVNFLCL